MSKLRINASKTFALEMVRSALSSPQIPREYRLTGMWMHMDMEMNDGCSSWIVLYISIYGAPSEVHASCMLYREDGVWDHGTCKIDLDEDPTQSWQFDCRVKDDHIIATPATAP